MTTFADQLEALPQKSEARQIILTVKDTYGRTVAVDGVEYGVGDTGPRFRFRLPDTFYVRSTKQDEEHDRRMRNVTVSDAEGDHLTVANMAHAFREHVSVVEKVPYTVSSNFSEVRVHVEDKDGRIAAPETVFAVTAADGKLDLRLRLPGDSYVGSTKKEETHPIQPPPPKAPSVTMHGPPFTARGKFDEAFLALVYGDMMASGLEERACRKAVASIEFAWEAFRSMKGLRE